MAIGLKTGGRKKGRPNNETIARFEAAAKVVEAVGAVIPDAFAGDAHAFLVGIYKDPSQDPHTRRDAAKAALPYEKARPVTVTTPTAEVPKQRSELEIGRRLAFVLELIARGEVKVKMPDSGGMVTAHPTRHPGTLPPNSSPKQGSDLNVER